MDRQASFISIWLQLELCALAVLLTKGIQNLVSHYLVFVSVFSATFQTWRQKNPPTDLRTITFNYL